MMCIICTKLSADGPIEKAQFILDNNDGWLYSEGKLGGSNVTRSVKPPEEGGERKYDSHH